MFIACIAYALFVVVTMMCIPDASKLYTTSDEIQSCVLMSVEPSR